MEKVVTGSVIANIISRLKEMCNEVNDMSEGLADIDTELVGVSQSLDNAYVCLRSARAQLERKMEGGHRD